MSSPPEEGHIVTDFFLPDEVTHNLTSVFKNASTLIALTKKASNWLKYLSKKVNSNTGVVPISTTLGPETVK